MPELKDFDGRFCESNYENAYIQAAESITNNLNWTYIPPSDIEREKKRDAIHRSDFDEFLSRRYPHLATKDIQDIYNIINLASGSTPFAAMHKTHDLIVNGIQFTPQGKKTAEKIRLVDFNEPANNIFHITNQVVVGYTDNGKEKSRRLDVVFYVNGLPLCIHELKDPTNEDTTIYDAWEQVAIRYWRDIPHFLKYSPIAVISDGVATRMGAVCADYEHFYAWKRTDDNKHMSPEEEFMSMMTGALHPARFLEIYRDFVCFQDEEYDNEEKVFVSRYPQFFGAKLWVDRIIEAIVKGERKGGLYWGATGCGKTVLLAYVARIIALRRSHVDELGSPTIILLVDRDDLQDQSGDLYTKIQDFLCLGDVKVIESRNELRNELKARESGGFYICTIQKFSDRENDPIGLISDRHNIITLSDEAHRTQTEKGPKIKYGKNDDEQMTVRMSKPYSQVVDEALPNAVKAGTTGTWTEDAIKTFGAIVDSYTMGESVEDGITVPIKYHPRASKVLFDEKKVKEIENYYSKCAEEGTDKASIDASKRAMTSMKKLLSDPDRLERIADDMYEHYTASRATDPDRPQKAMVVECDRKTAWKLFKIITKKHPELLKERQAPEGMPLSREDKRHLPKMPAIAMVASNSPNDEKEMYDYLGGATNNARNKKMSAAYKMDKSNLRIVIVVDMWITGFDVPTLTYLYNDKPLQKHLLIQTISRVNRKYPGKKWGMIIDYVGIRDSMREALKIYSGDGVVPTEDDVQQSKTLFLNELGTVKTLFADEDILSFSDASKSDLERYQMLSSAADYVFSSDKELSLDETKKDNKVSFKTYFLAVVKRMKKAYDACQPAGVLSEEDIVMAQGFMAVSGLVRKMNGTSRGVDTMTMNRKVAMMVEEALRYSDVESLLENEDEEFIFSDEFIKKLDNVSMPATKLEILIKMLRRKIAEYEKVNKLESKKFQEMLEDTIFRYHKRRKRVSADEAGETQEVAADWIIEDALKQALEILEKLDESKESFRKLGLTFEEKAFYDILVNLRDKYDFEYGEDKEKDGIIVNEKCLTLSQKVKEIIDAKSSFADWLNNKRVRDQLKLDIKMCLVKNGYPPQYSPEVFEKVMEQVENFEEHASDGDN